MTHAHTLSDFDFHLPPELIAQDPAPVRSASRLLDGTGSTPVDRFFYDLPQQLHSGDLIVVNDTKVIKARLYGAKPTGGEVELLVERVLNKREVAAHMKASKKPVVGTVLAMQGGWQAKVLGRWPTNEGPLFKLSFSEEPYALMQKHGHVPLPPYIDHEDTKQDEQRYQTIFAAQPGAVAAPTAALHMDQTVLNALEARGILRASVTLHVGAGTFQPVKTENLNDHVMHSERFEVPEATQAAIAETKARGNAVVALGTTTLRALEAWASSGQNVGETQIFIKPGYEFKVVDALITNFHLPKSTLLMLISAFVGYERVRALYQYAIAQRYRFFSYGDAMLLRRSSEKSQ